MSTTPTASPPTDPSTSTSAVGAAPSRSSPTTSPRPSSTSPGRDSDQVRVSASDDGRVLAVEVPRHRRLGSPPRLDITVRIPSGSTVDLGTASASITTRGLLAKADVKTASGEVSIEQVDGDCHADAASGDVAPRHDRWRRPPARARPATCGSPAWAVAARPKSASGAVDIGWAGDLVSARQRLGRRHGARRRPRRGGLQVDVRRRRRRRAQGHARVARPHHRVRPHHLWPRSRRRRRAAAGGGPHGEGADGERQHHDQPRAAPTRPPPEALPAPGGSTTVASRPERRS